MNFPETTENDVQNGSNQLTPYFYVALGIIILGAIVVVPIVITLSCMVHKNKNKKTIKQ